MWVFIPVLLSFVNCAFWMAHATAETGVDGNVCNEGEDSNNVPSCTSPNDQTIDGTSKITDGCTLVMAPSGVPDGGWGIYTLTPRKRGQKVLDHGDIVIHITDPNPHSAHEMMRLIWGYIWDGQETGGHYEGMRVMSAVSGFGALTNGVPRDPSIVHGRPSVDDAGLKRNKFPGAGAISHYHNFTWTMAKDLDAGEELYIEYGPGWFKERGIDGNGSLRKFDVSDLREAGYCLDHIEGGAPSRIEGAGRGAFASRDLQEGSIVAPVPLLALSRASLQSFRERRDGSRFASSQLLQNYCLGHPDSSLLLYPYSHGVNFINHDSNSPNVKLQWWEGSHAFFEKSFIELQQSNTSQLMLELIATRSIRKGEEIVLDYGQEWLRAWTNHVRKWQPREDVSHISAEAMNNDNDFIVLRTREEQLSKPYPADVFTSCYYRYSDFAKANGRPPATGPDPTQTVARWKPGMKESRNLRPCVIIQRDAAMKEQEVNDVGRYFYTVRVMNRPSLRAEERIQKDHVHFATHVPRSAIMFSDKTYTSDQHLEHAFRKEIGMGDLFPDQWKDLV
ncbi:hypothetical protein ACHAWF_017657 [Thalassiosira exigua]